jgi:Ca2+-binding RTX toxin-like protein
MSDGQPIVGTADADFLQGTALSDEIYGLAGDDIIEAGDGDDLLDGGDGADLLTGGAGDDVYIVDEFDTVVEADGEGDDEVRTTVSYYALADYLERLTGLSQDGQELIGNSLDNIIVGGSGGDVLRGGLGNDSLTGGDGSDIYVFWRGEGDDRISVVPNSGHDSLQLLDIFMSNVTVSQSGYDLILTFDESGGSITLLGSASSFTSLAEIIFADGTWSNADLLAYSTATTGEGPDTLTGDDNDNVIAGLGGDDILDGAGGNDSLDGGDGDDVLTGGTGDDVIEGGTGGDSLAGGEGNDSFRFAPGFGQDVIADSSGAAGGYDRIEFLDSILPGDVTATIDGADVLISINGTTDQIRIANMIVDPESVIEEITFADGTVYYLSQLLGPQFQYGTAGNDSLTGTTLTDILYGEDGDDILGGNSGSDYLVGGLGDDVLSGGAGNDGYSYSAGDGNDVIVEYEGAGDGGYDDLDIYDYERSDTTVVRSSDGFSYILYFGGGEESITLYGAASGDPKYRVEWINFNYGMLRGVTLGAFAVDVGNGDDVLTVTAGSYYGARGLGGNDVITGSDDSDWLRGDAGDDSLIGGGGGDQLDGGIGADALDGGEGDDWLQGGAGADILAGGAGNDYYYVDDSGDSVVEAAGEGDDQVLSTAASYTLGDNVEWLTGMSEAGQVLIGNALDNEIRARWGDDILEGGAGDDLLDGGDGLDVYRFDRGDGDDTITDWASWLGPNALEFGSGILPGNVRVIQSDSSFILEIDADGGSVTLAYALYSGAFEVRFVDGTVWGGTDLYAQSLRGTEAADTRTGGSGDDILDGLGGDDILDGSSGNDTLKGAAGSDILNGSDGNDVVEGGAGADFLTGSYGDDTYRFERGFGSDILSDGDFWSSGYDRIEFLGDIDPSEVIVWSTDGGNTLLLSIDGTSDRIRIDRASTSWGTPAIKEVAFADGTLWTGEALLAMAVPAPTDGDLVGTGEADTLLGGSGNDVIRGEGGADDLDGGDGNDELHGGLGDDILTGGAGDDLYFFGALDGHDVIVENEGAGDGGFDWIWLGDSLLRSEMTIARSPDGLHYILYFGGGEQSITLTGAAGGGSQSRIEGIRFAADDPYLYMAFAEAALDVGNGDDVITATGYFNRLRGLGGNDVIVGNEGMDWLKGDGGNDVLIGGNGDDELDGGAGYDVLVGGAQRDVYVVDSALDTVVESPDEGDDEVRTTLAAYVLPGNVERLTGLSDSGQQLTGNALDNILWGASGDDILRGGLGNDVLGGGNGADIYRFARGDGDDYIDGSGGGADVLEFSSDILPSQVTVTQSQSGWEIIITVDQGGGSITNRGFGQLNPLEVRFADGTVWSPGDLADRSMAGTEGDDIRTGDGRDNLLLGLGGDDVLDGSWGNDTLDGGGGADVLDGSWGDDTIVGGNGNDILIGGYQKDVATGGAGADVFLFRQWDLTYGSNADRITDFTQGEDVIDLSEIDPDWTSWDVDEAFTFIGNAAFTGAVGEVRYIFDGADTRLQFDWSGDGIAEYELVLTGNIPLQAADFIL